MIHPHSSKVLMRHRAEDERGLHYTWASYAELMGAMQLITEQHPEEHVPQPDQALQDAFSMALHQAQAVLVEAGDLTHPGEHEWNGTPIWLEFQGGREYGGLTFEGALVFALRLQEAKFVIPVLMGKGKEWPLPFVLRGSLLRLLGSVPDDPAGLALLEVLSALTHVPALPKPARVHESNTTLLPRLERHLRRVKSSVPQTAARLVHAYLKHRSQARWDARVFVPQQLTALSLMEREGLSESNALLIAPEVTLITAWRYAKHVYRLDEDVLEALRRANAPKYVPLTLRGLRGHVSYFPIPGGLARPDQSGFFAGFDDVGGVPHLTLLIEHRAHGDHLLAPISLPLGAPIEETMRSMVQTGTVNFTDDEVRRVIQSIKLALLATAYLGSQGTELHGLGTPAPVQPRPGRSKQELVEAGHVSIWEAGTAHGERLRAYQVQRAQASAGGSQGSGKTGRSMPPHIRSFHPHGYWVGEGRREYEIRWLDDIPVNMGEDDGRETPVRLE